METHTQEPKTTKDLLFRMIGALGVVYGDIGTSVLYSVQESFFGHHPLAQTHENVLGVLSIFFWTLVLVVGLKYVLLIMRADNKGEGGIFALLALISAAKKRLGPAKISIAWALIIMGAALLLADGMITPAISVLSAVSGLEVIAPALSRWVVPITISVLIGLFIVQPSGTSKIGVVFGPIMLVWFFSLAAMAVPHILEHPEVFSAINPIWAVKFVIANGFSTMLTLGSVVLCITGAEALYADMGHFGRKPITVSWWFLIFPALIANYFGQGAMLLRSGEVPGGNIFYSLAPAWALVPTIVLATAATIIASQSLISGSFSLIQQAIALGVFPRQRIIHTNPNIRGQIYLPFVNWSLMIGCLGLVLIFRSSSALAAAYGIAVTGTMGITTIGFYLVCRHIWNWRKSVALLVCGLFLSIDLVFFSSNLIKFLSGGYVPILIGLLIFSIMHTWYWGRSFIAQHYQKAKYLTVEQLLTLKKSPSVTLLNRSIVVMASRPIVGVSDTIPPALQSRLNHLGAIYRDIAVLSVFQNPGQKEVDSSSRSRIDVLQDDERGSFTAIKLEYGFMEDPDLSEVLPSLAKQGVIHTDGSDGKAFTILSGAERIVDTGAWWFDSLRLWFFRFLLRNANTVLKYFNLEYFPDVSVEVVTLGADSNFESFQEAVGQ